MKKKIKEKPKRKPKKKVRARSKRKPKIKLKSIEVSESTYREIMRLITKFKKNKKKFEPYQILEGYIKMTKFYRLNVELELALNGELNS